MSDELKNIIHTSRVAHVTFYITKVQDMEQWKLYSETEKDGLHECVGEVYYDYSEAAPTQNEYFNQYDSLEEATQGMQKEIARLERILEYKRKGTPTQKQLFFLFREKIPIPLTLTWGEASDLIEERLAQKEYERQAKQVERFHGLVEGDTVAFQWAEIDDTGYHKVVKTGVIAQLYQAGGRKFAKVKVNNKTIYRVRDFTTIQKIDGSEARFEHGATP